MARSGATGSTRVEELDPISRYTGRGARGDNADREGDPTRLSGRGRSLRGWMFEVVPAAHAGCAMRRSKGPAAELTDRIDNAARDGDRPACCPRTPHEAHASCAARNGVRMEI